MKVGPISGRIWAVIAVAVALAFVGGFYASVYVSNPGSKGNHAVNDNYPYGECVGQCPQHNFIFAPDMVTVGVIQSGRLVYLSSTPNLITNAGEDLISRQTACGAIAAPTCANGGIYIALSNDTVTPAATDTACSLEQTANGLTRTQGTYAHSAGSNQHTITATFTYTTSAYSTTISKVCMFDAALGGNLFAETLLSPTATVSATGDQITITWTFVH